MCGRQRSYNDYIIIYYSSCLSFPFLLPNKGQSLTVVALGSVLLFLCKPHCHFYFNLAVGVNLIVFSPLVLTFRGNLI